MALRKGTTKAVKAAGEHLIDGRASLDASCRKVAGQPEDVYTLWGYGLFTDRDGDFVGKPMAEATGREILTELLGHPGMSDIEEQVAATTTVIPVMMPYITSRFAPRTVHDRPW